MLSQITNLHDPFFLFLFVEVIALLVLLVVWLDIGFSLIYVALYGHVTPKSQVCCSRRSMRLRRHCRSR